MNHHKDCKSDGVCVSACPIRQFAEQGTGFKIPLQNIPLHTELGHKIREAFRDSWPEVADYEALELHVLAQVFMTQEEHNFETIEEAIEHLKKTKWRPEPWE